MIIEGPKVRLQNRKTIFLCKEIGDQRAVKHFSYNFLNYRFFSRWNGGPNPKRKKRLKKKMLLEEPIPVLSLSTTFLHQIGISMKKLVPPLEFFPTAAKR